MRPPARSRFSPARTGLVLLAAAVIAAGGTFLLKNHIGKRLRDIDPRASWAELSFSHDAVRLRGLSLPGRGFTSDSAWVLLEGLPFNVRPVQVVFSGGSFSPSADDDRDPGTDQGTTGLAVSVENLGLPDGTVVHGGMRSGVETALLAGPWGRITAVRSDGRITAVFSGISGVPLSSRSLPGPLSGHTVSGICSGVSDQVLELSGVITAVDGREAAADFHCTLGGGIIQTAGLEMDFAQVSQPALAMLDSLTSGSVMTDAPSGSLSVRIAGGDSLFFTTSLTFDSLSVYRAEIAPDTFSASARLFCGGVLLPRSGILLVDTGMVRFNTAEMFFRIEGEWGERRRMNLLLFNHGLSGEEISESVPDELLGRLRGLSLGGELDFTAELLLDWDMPESSNVEIDVNASNLYVGWSPVSFSALRQPDGGAFCTMTDSWGNRRTIPLDTLANTSFIPFDSIPGHLEPLLCCAEDASFRRHHGFSEYHIRNSIRADMEQGRFVRGGSTLTMQLAKNLFLGREKTLARKLQEVFLTWRIERWLTKDRILELYVNIVELGPNVFGFDQAAEYYFDTSISGLTVRETAFLVSILPGPGVYHRFAERGELPQYWNAYVNRLISICGSRGWLDMETVEYALSDTLIFRGGNILGGVDNSASQNY